MTKCFIVVVRDIVHQKAMRIEEMGQRFTKLLLCWNPSDHYRALCAAISISGAFLQAAINENLGKWKRPSHRCR
jgi:hypothetical protein